MKLIEKMAMILLIVVSIWFFASYVDVLAHNNPVDGNHSYQPWNVFVLAFEK